MLTSIISCVNDQSILNQVVPANPIMSEEFLLVALIEITQMFCTI